jgi:hypothetical protein
MNTFIFPKNIDGEIQDRQRLMNMIDMENKFNGSRIMYRYYEIRKHYLYAKCKHKGCKAQIRYKRKDSEEFYHIFFDQRTH